MVADTMTMRMVPTGEDPDFDAFLSFLNGETKTIPAPPKAAPVAEPVSPSSSTTSSLSDDAFVIEVAKARPSLANLTPVVQKPKQASATPAAKTIKIKVMSASGTDTSMRTAATASSVLSYRSYRTYNDLIKEKSAKNLKPPTAANPDSSYYGIFKGSGPTPPSMRNLDDSIVTKKTSFKYYGIFNGQGPTPASMGGDAEGKTSSTISSKKEKNYKYFGVFEGSGPTPGSQRHLENARAKSYNDLIREKSQAKLAEASLSDEPKEILYYGIFKGSGPAPGEEPTDPGETSSLKKKKSHKYYGLFEGAGPVPESQRHLVKETPKSYNDLIREKSQANMKENGECLYYGVFRGM